ncbi:glycosyltransferase family 4 protein [Pontibacter liquoris]|uniref:glycosyltransferase family 4 protein n=1 Tax=Pontibacter liquoris TaxID=2905677 RepID=UPI001FA80BE1|nr:glycosyltransferase family 4 protein [Pontibacter liquoris]
MKVLFVFELGLLHYRIPILEKIAMDESIEKCDIIHTEEHTNNVYKFIELKATVKTYGKFKLLPEVKKLKDDYDVIVFSFNLWRPSWIYTLFSARKAKYILWGQGFGRDNNYWIARKAKLHFANWADALIFYTESGCADFQAHGIPREKMFVARNTLHVGNSERSAEALKTDLLYVGRIQERKGVDSLIKAFAMIREEVPEYVKVRIVGNGDVTSLRSLVEEHALQDRVIFEPGVFEEEKQKQVFFNALAYVSPDHVGLGVVHSFAYGVPVITNKNRKHAPEFEYCDETNSLLYEGGVQELAQKLKLICNNRALQEELSKGSYTYYDNHLRSDIMVKGFLDAFNYTMSRRPDKAMAVGMDTV